MTTDRTILKYVSFDTQSDDNSGVTPQYTPKQNGICTILEI